MDALIGALVSSEGRHEILKHTAWGMSNLCRGTPCPDIEYVRKALPCLRQLLSVQDEEVHADALWAFSYIADGESDKIDILIQSDVLSTVVQALSSHKDEFVMPAIRVVGNIATGSVEQTQAVLACGTLDYLQYSLYHPKLGLQKKACWLLSNVAAGTPDQIQTIIDAGP